MGAINSLTFRAVPVTCIAAAPPAPTNPPAAAAAAAATAAVAAAAHPARRHGARANFLPWVPPVQAFPASTQ
ncbi:hypothetical protein E2C01_042145 [Portunus trituberculatus]|uniref:Uncharacterized protein n=1 Tax=Portunus trituberculatus TaxID=210409 RepID=A0A5B7FVN4_PORTR|nr:hypothetical protein [Portunus trituberculatus]